MLTLAVTCGDAAGIGPELVARALALPQETWGARLAVYGDAALLWRVAVAAKLEWPEMAVVAADDPWPETGHVVVESGAAESLADVVSGQVQAVCGEQAHAWICGAVRDVLAGRAQGLVTAPIHKQAMHLAGVDFPGHTELLAHLTQTRDVRMMFWSGRLRVVLATIHEALADVPRLLTREHVAQTICFAAEAAGPRVGVLALNPHAGEGGLFGREEAEILLPAIAAARARGISVEGPLVPDTAFCWLGEGRPAPYDVFVAMYHDQGLIPFKMVAFHDGVNVTLGLPFVRTSPDHGTAFNLAWQGKADPESFFSAIRLAARMCKNDGAK